MVLVQMKLELLRYMYSIFMYAQLFNSESLYLYWHGVTLLLPLCKVRPINQNGDVPLHKGQNIGTGRPSSLPSDLDIDHIVLSLGTNSSENKCSSREEIAR